MMGFFNLENHPFQEMTYNKIILFKANKLGMDENN